MRVYTIAFTDEALKELSSDSDFHRHLHNALMFLYEGEKTAVPVGWKAEIKIERLNDTLA